MPSSPVKFDENLGEIGAYLAELRRSRQYSLRRVEEMTDHAVSNAYLSQLEHGRIKKPSPNVLHSLGRVYGVGYDVLMRKAGYAGTSGREVPPKEAGSRNALKLDDFSEDELAQLRQYADFLRSCRKHGE